MLEKIFTQIEEVADIQFRLIKNKTVREKNLDELASIINETKKEVDTQLKQKKILNNSDLPGNVLSIFINKYYGWNNKIKESEKRTREEADSITAIISDLQTREDLTGLHFLTESDATILKQTSLNMWDSPITLKIIHKRYH